MLDTSVNYYANEKNERLSLISSVAQSRLILWPHGLQHARPPCPSPTPRVYSNPCPLSQWCHPTILSSVILFSCLQSFPASGSFQMTQLFASGSQSVAVSVSTSAFPMRIQDWFPLGWTGWISQERNLTCSVTVEKASLRCLIACHWTHTYEKPFICSECGKGSPWRTVLAHISKLTEKRNYICAVNVGKAFQQSTTSSYISKLIQERNRMCVVSAEKASLWRVILYISAIILLRNHLYAVIVGKPLLWRANWLYMSELIQGRNPTYAVNAGRPLQPRPTSSDISELTLERNPIYAVIVEKASFRKAVSLCMNELTVEKPSVCSKCVAKAYSQKGSLVHTYELILERNHICVMNIARA